MVSYSNLRRYPGVSVGASLRLLKFEAIVTAGMFAMPVMNDFFASIGMDQAQIGWSQAIFTIVLFALNIPTGRFADRRSRRMANAIGDLIVAGSIVGYAFAPNFFWVVFAEIVFGVGMALTGGVDTALLREYCKTLGEKFSDHRGWISTFRPWVEIVGVLVVGGAVGAYDIRWAIALSSVPFFIGAIVSCFLREEGEKPEHSITLVDVVRTSLHTDTVLKWHIFAYAVGREVTHALVWVLTPLMLLAGVPALAVSIGWALNLVMSSLGGVLAKRVVHRFNWWERFAVGMGGSLGAIAVLACTMSLWSVWLLGILGLTRGWFSVTGEDAIVHHSDAGHQATIMSIAMTAANVLYVPTVAIVNSAGTANVRGALVATLVIFAPLAVICSWKLRTLE